MRIANAPTAVADVCAGFFIVQAVTGGLSFSFTDHGMTLFCLSVTSVCLYSAGMVFNDLFDRKVDAIERPERPIPSGKVTSYQAGVFGSILVLVGLLSAFSISSIVGIATLLLTFLIFTYDASSKRFPYFSVLNMGLCRGVNLLLGMSVYADISLNLLALAVALSLFVAGITLASKGEVFGGTQNGLNGALITYVLALFLLIFVGKSSFSFPIIALLLLGLWLLLAILPLLKARNSLKAQDVRKAVKAGILSIILLDAAMVGGFCGIYPALFILALFPISFWASNPFPVT